MNCEAIDALVISEPSTPLTKRRLSFGHFLFYEDYVVSIIDEGEDLDAGMLLQFYSLCDEVFGHSPYAVIDLRANSFSTDPSFYIKYRQALASVTAHALVIGLNTSVKLNQFEVQCIRHCPCKSFYTLDEAVSWIKQTR